MVTKEQAMVCDRFHYTGRHACFRHVGVRGGVTERVTNVRRNGATKVWKRSPDRFSVPIKYGMYEYACITEGNCSDFHVESECPLLMVESGVS